MGNIERLFKRKADFVIEGTDDEGKTYKVTFKYVEPEAIEVRKISNMIRNYGEIREKGNEEEIEKEALELWKKQALMHFKKYVDEDGEHPFNEAIYDQLSYVIKTLMRNFLYEKLTESTFRRG